MKRKRRRRMFLAVLLLLTGVFLLGPRPSYPEIAPEITPLNLQPNQVEAYVQAKEAKISNLKKGNQSQFMWADSLPTQTEYCVLFLHGFSASPEAGIPFVPEIANRYNANVYMPLLAGHGRDTDEALKDLTPVELVASTNEALAIARIMGKKTIVIGSSTGCTLGLYAAAHNPQYADVLLMYSPNIDLADWKSNLLLWPWGRNLAYLLSGKYYHYEKLKNTPSEQYWNTTYRVEGLQALKFLLSETMTDEVFAKIKQPLFVGYYYKDEDNHDNTISIPALKSFYESVGTPANQKEIVQFPDVEGHVMLSGLQAKGIDETLARSFEFLAKIIP